MNAVELLTKQMFPGVVVVPVMSAGAPTASTCGMAGFLPTASTALR
jgi:hypothetical protein